MSSRLLARRIAALRPDRLARLTRYPLAARLALGLGVCLALPSVFVGLTLDDLMHQAILKGFPAMAGPFDLFRFASGDAAAMRPFIENGPYPWWTNPDLKLAFFRPLASALIQLDAWFFGQAVWLHHIHSVVWYAGLIAAAALLFERVLPRATAGLALVLFAIDDVHWMPVGWLANRHALVSMLPALLGLFAHVRARQRGSWLGVLCAPALLGLGLLGGESALGMGAYLLAYELVGAPDGWRRRLVALLPTASLVLAYLAFYRALGFGASGSGVYLDPASAPLDLALAIPGRLLALVACQLAGLPADLWITSAAARGLQVVIGASCLVGGGALLHVIATRLDGQAQAALRWLSLGALLSLLPVTTTLPTTRLLLVPSLGACAAVATAMVACARWAWRARGGRLLAWGLFAVHVPLSLAGWAGQGLVFGTLARRAEAVFRTAEVDFQRLGSQRVVFVAAPDFATALYGPVAWATYGLSVPRAWWVISMAPHAHRFTRTDANRFELEVLDGRMLESTWETLVRAPSLPVERGHRVRNAGMEVEVLESEDGKPRKVAVSLGRALEDPEYVFLEWRDGGLRRLELPAVGGVVELPKSGGLVEL